MKKQQHQCRAKVIRKRKQRFGGKTNLEHQEEAKIASKTPTCFSTLFCGLPMGFIKKTSCSPLFKYSTEVIFHYISTSSSLAREVKVGNVPREEDTQVTSSEGFFSIKNLQIYDLVFPTIEFWEIDDDITNFILQLAVTNVDNGLLVTPSCN